MKLSFSSINSLSGVYLFTTLAAIAISKPVAASTATNQENARMISQLLLVDSRLPQRNADILLIYQNKKDPPPPGSSPRGGSR